MAIIKFGATVVGVRGTIGGITYSANKAGPHAKIWTRGANPRTTNQARQRNNQSTCAAAWRSITGAQQTAWDTYAAAAPQQLFNSLGIGYFISGFAWFCSMNSNLLRAGAAINAPAPVLAIPAAPTVTSFVFRATATAGASVIRTNVADVNKAMLKAGFFALYNSIGRRVTVTRTPLMAIKQVIIGGASDGQWQFKTESEAKYGTTFVGQQGFFFMYNQNAEGRRSVAWASGASALV